MSKQFLEFETYFNILQFPFPDIDPDLFILFIPVLGLSVTLVAKFIGAESLHTLLLLIFVTAVGWLGTYIAKENYMEAKGLRTMLAKNLTDIVEGKITNFTPLPATRKGYESFQVGEIEFHYTDGREEKGFARSRLYGRNILKEGMRVRIHYYENHILKIEIAKSP